MHRGLARAAVAATLFASLANAQTPIKVLESPPMTAQPQPVEMIVADAIVVQFEFPAAVMLRFSDELARGRTGVNSLDAIAAQLNVSNLRQQFQGADPQVAAQRGLPDLSGYYIVTFDPNAATVDEALAAYRNDALVKSAQPIGIHSVFATPNDSSYSSQWHLNQANDKDIDAPEAWDIETGDPSMIVAVLDTGVRYYHKDLGGSGASAANPTGTDGNIWINLAEKNGVAGVDDDGNGYVDDWVGYDFVTGVSGCSSGEDCSTPDNDPRDFNGHGTHCSGIVAAINNNGYAVASPAGGWNAGVNTPSANGVKVMPLRIGYSALGGGYVRMDFAASAFYYAANNGAKIASCSWGSSNSGGIAAALDYFIASGGLIFVAAGNSNNQTAGYLNSRSDCYSVAATDQNDVKASFSSYGTWVDISAPGVSILSTYHSSSDPNNDYVASLSGTSMACPMVASTAAAVWSRNPTWTAAQVWDRVRTTVDSISAQNPSFNGLLGSGRINLLNAVNSAPPPPPQCQSNADCDDGNPCNGAEICVGGNCQSGSITDCNANGIADSCDISGGSSQDCNANGIPDECEGGNPCGSGATLLLVFTSTTTLPGGLTVENEDIAAFNTGTGQWSLYFDGSDVGLSSFAINALAVDANGDLLISLTAAGTVGGISADDSDILRFAPTSLGASTAGTWSLHFDGSDVGLTTSSEDIDAIAIAPDGRLIISVLSSASVPGVSAADEDLLAFDATSLGNNTAGTWSLYFDGSDVALSSTSENVDGVSILPNGLISLSTSGNFSVSGLSGANEDVFDFSPSSLGSNTSGTFSAYFDGTVHGVPSGADVAAVHELP